MPEFGVTWWGRRWRRALESLGATYPNPRLPHGRSLARKGAVEDMAVVPGAVTARVRDGSRTREVGLHLPVFGDDEWTTAVTALAGRLRHAIALLEGRLPEDVDDTLGEAGVPLFPRRGELGSTCGCSGRAHPCAHAAAVHYVVARALDDDPFLLTRLRGRDRDRLLAELRAARGGEAPAPTATGGLPLAEVEAGSLFTAGTSLASVAAHPCQPGGHMPEALRMLGPAPGLDADDWRHLVAVARRAADRAWSLAGDAGDADGPPG
ncbi:hypothetical protein HUO13_23495 [Saccharopolyspora erythraea]|uniref:SWIM zinc finger family protein n=1 Tax=Saccharopolyspora erythraea TaxID=1836 RepID=UPI001BA8168D|nr:hypothetical protein [Saccharopolyspora erythraea]QUH03395.1 hypothetical protein HUO13_23495 [Saccharopolyspora erythraea]